ncbi:MAG: FmdB family transcriptional regulator [Proteobacteria bacterium]|nr:FmdB family transcriptional regulator [Pseudomonadota bacterium]
MPLYDYRCSACGVVREHRQSISEEPLSACPECGGEYKRIITSVGIIFKGSGFHINDYRGSGSSSSTSSEGEAKNDPAPSSEGTSESKGEKPSDSGSSSSEGAQGKQVA